MLGCLFYYEIVLGVVFEWMEGLGIYFCVFCYFVLVGFQVGCFQGIGEGGIGIGINGQDCFCLDIYNLEELDV